MNRLVLPFVALGCATVGAAGCGSAAVTSVVLELRYDDGVADGAMTSGKRLLIDVSGAETFKVPPIALAAQLQGRMVATLRYRPTSKTGSLTFRVVVDDGAGTLVASGEGSASIVEGGEARLPISLRGEAVMADLGQVDGPPRDLASASDAPGVDASVDAALDLAIPPDLAVADLATLDLAKADLASLPDAAVAVDLSRADLVPLPDLAMPADLLSALDLLPSPDLAPLADLASAPDLAGACTLDADCKPKNQYCTVMKACRAKQPGGGDCTGDGDKACLSANCVNNKCYQCPKGMKFVENKGAVTLGSEMADVTADPDERPAHQVTITSFCVDQTEVTVVDYRACVTAKSCMAPMKNGGGAPNCSYTDNVGALDKRPVNCLTWQQAKDFCEWAGDGTVHLLGARRLLTEAEWEKHARGGDRRLFAWGNQQPDCNYANFAPGGNSCAVTSPPVKDVGSLPMGTSASETADATGNVAEWVSDWYDKGYYASACGNGCSDPKGPNASPDDWRVFRGGAWNSPQKEIRVTYRGADSPTGKYVNVGVRCGASMF